VGLTSVLRASYDTDDVAVRNDVEDEAVSIPRDLPAHLQCTAQQRLHEPPSHLIPLGRGDGADQEQPTDPGQEVQEVPHAVGAHGVGPPPTRLQHQ
jgi:hypothetical protein